jgi:hypothetical protein
MEMVIHAHALNMTSEEAIAPRQNMVSWLMSKVGSVAAVPSHILALTKVDLAAEG